MLEKFLSLALEQEDLGAQDLDSHLATTLGLAVKAAAEDQFGGNCVIENFKQDPEVLTSKVFDLLDVNGNGDLSREEFLKNAPQVKVRHLHTLDNIRVYHELLPPPSVIFREKSKGGQIRMM